MKKELTQKQRMISVLFEGAIEGESSNAYRKVLLAFGYLPIEAKRIVVTLNDIYEALMPLSRQWDREVDKIVS